MLLSSNIVKYFVIVYWIYFHIFLLVLDKYYLFSNQFLSNFSINNVGSLSLCLIFK